MTSGHPKRQVNHKLDHPKRQEHPRHHQDRGDENALPREELAHGRVDRAVDHAWEVHHGVHRREEGFVQPTVMLANKTFDRLGNVGLRHGTFAVVHRVHRPPLVRPGDNFGTQHAVFGQVHVAQERSQLVHRRGQRLAVAHQRTFRLLGQGVLLCLDGLVLVRRELARKDVDETERGARRAVQNIEHFVLEVLNRHGDLAEVGTVRRQLHADTGNLRVPAIFVVSNLQTPADGFDVDQNPIIGLQMFDEGLKEPGVGVELPGVVLLPREDPVDRRQREG